MIRILLILLFIALDVFALAHWATRSKRETPGGLNRWLWLLVILIVPVVGPVAWLGSYIVMRAERIQREAYAKDAYYQQPPDDNPEAIARVVERIKRRQGKSTEHSAPDANSHANSQSDVTSSNDKSETNSEVKKDADAAEETDSQES